MSEHSAAVSRRDLLKKSAVAGAIVWTTPVLMSSPAFAATGKCSGSKPCVNFYYVKIEGTEVKCDGASDGNNTGCTNYTSAQLACPGLTPQQIAALPAVQNGCALVTGSETNSAATITYAPGVVPLKIQIKYGPNCQEWNYNEATNSFVPPPSPCGTITVAGNPASGLTANIVHTCQNGISHMNTYFCK